MFLRDKNTHLNVREVWWVSNVSVLDIDFRALADNIPTLCWTANPDGYIIWYNKGWYEYTGTTPDAMEGWGWQSVHDPDELPSVLKKFPF